MILTLSNFHPKQTRNTIDYNPSDLTHLNQSMIEYNNKEYIIFNSKNYVTKTKWIEINLVRTTTRAPQFPSAAHLCEVATATLYTD